ncbi:MAG: PQQ-binding-like beta-propeller repeat protein [Spirochaetes bacterium]|nr:PQQ-binding-like beta-propeller repeat protein [Spirochaetota bacterium]
MPRASVYRLVKVVIIAAFSIAGLTAFDFLVIHDPVSDLAEHLPGEDGSPANLPPSDTVAIGQYFQRFDGIPSAIAASWPGFRGIARDNTSHEAMPLAVPTPGWQPPILWSVELGEGHAGAAVANGRVYVMDYDEARQADTLRCFSLDDGKEIWRRWYTVRLKRNHGISRTIPAVNGKHVVTIGPGCHVMCCDALTGSLAWGIDLAREHGTEVPLWYTGQCPLVDGSQAVIAVCGADALLMGVDLATGRVAWRTPNPAKLKMSHSSIVTATIGGVRTYVYAAIGGIVGISAEPASRGALLWNSPAFDATVIAPSPVPIGDGRIFLTAGYGAGSIMLRVSRTGGSFATEVLYRHRPTEGFACEHQTPVLFQGMLIGVLPKDAGTRRAELACWDPAGRWAWTSGQDRRFGLGPYLLADGKLVVLNEDGVLTIAEASTAAYRPLGSAKILEGPDAWAPMALVAGRLVARDTHRMVCVDLRRNP